MDALREMTAHGLDAMLVIDQEHKLKGVVEREQMLSKLMIGMVSYRCLDPPSQKLQRTSAAGMPRVRRAKIEVQYQVGGGPSGNWAARSLTKALSSQPNLTITQPFAAIGGAEAETLSEAKGPAVALLTEPQRAITLKDFEDLTLATPGVPVARAHGIADYDPALPSFPALGCVTIVVVPHCPDPLRTTRNIESFRFSVLVLSSIKTTQLKTGN